MIIVTGCPRSHIHYSEIRTFQTVQPKNEFSKFAFFYINKLGNPPPNHYKGVEKGS